MMSASDQLLEAGAIEQATIDAAKKEMNEVKVNPNSVFLYSFMQAQATVLPSVG